MHGHLNNILNLTVGGQKGKIRERQNRSEMGVRETKADQQMSMETQTTPRQFEGQDRTMRNVISISQNGRVMVMNNNMGENLDLVDEASRSSEYT